MHIIQRALIKELSAVNLYYLSHQLIGLEYYYFSMPAIETAVIQLIAFHFEIILLASKFFIIKRNLPILN